MIKDLPFSKSDTLRLRLLNTALRHWQARRQKLAGDNASPYSSQVLEAFDTYCKTQTNIEAPDHTRLAYQIRLLLNPASFIHRQLSTTLGHSTTLSPPSLVLEQPVCSVVLVTHRKSSRTGRSYEHQKMLHPCNPNGLGGVFENMQTVLR